MWAFPDLTRLKGAVVVSLPWGLLSDTSGVRFVAVNTLTRLKCRKGVGFHSPREKSLINILFQLGWRGGSESCQLIVRQLLRVYLR